MRQNRGRDSCALHTAETLGDPRRTKLRRFKTGPGDAAWLGTPDVADDLDRLFPAVGADLEATGIVSARIVGAASARIVGFPALVDFATPWIAQRNAQSTAATLLR